MIDKKIIKTPEKNKVWSDEFHQNLVKEFNEERKRGQFDVISWLVRQNEYTKYANNPNRIGINVKAGEIYEVDFGINVNAEFSYRHYALILMDSAENNPLALVCPLKSNNKGANPKSDINLGVIEDLDVDHESLAVINQIRSIDKMRIFKRPIIRKNKEFDNSQHDNIKDESYRLEGNKFKMIIKMIQKYLEDGTFI